jgi:hypothetical protein
MVLSSKNRGAETAVTEWKRFDHLESEYMNNTAFSKVETVVRKETTMKFESEGLS